MKKLQSQVTWEMIIVDAPCVEYTTPDCAYLLEMYKDCVFKGKKGRVCYAYRARLRVEVEWRFFHEIMDNLPGF